MPLVWSAPSHYLNQFRNIVNLFLRNKLQWNINRNSFIFIHENAFENVVCEMVVILSRSQYVNTMRPRESEHHFADDAFKYIFLNENLWIPIKISLTFVSTGPFNDIPPLLQIMACRLGGDKPLSEPMMTSLLTLIPYCCSQISHTSPSRENGVYFEYTLKYTIKLTHFKQILSNNFEHF